MPYERALHRREAPPLQCETVLRRAICGLYSAQPAFAWRARARLCAVCLWGGGAARTLVARAHSAALVVVAPCPTKWHCTGEKPLSFGARPCCDVPPATSNAQPDFAWRARACHCACFLLGGGEARAPAARACRATPVLWPMHYITPLHRREASPLRCETLLRRASCGVLFAQPAFASVFARTLGLALSRERRRCT